MTTFQNWSNELPPLVVLAGGKSERMKKPKGLLDFFGEPWLLYQLSRYHVAGGKQVALVLGFNAEPYLTALPFLKINSTVKYNQLNITTLINPLPAFGPFSTIQTGLSFLLKGQGTSFSFLALDKPAPCRCVWHQLADILVTKKADMVFPVRNGKDGHPVMISKRFAQEIISLPAENTRMDFLRKTLPPRHCLAIEQTDKNIGFNLNTPEQWQDFLNQYRTEQDH